MSSALENSLFEEFKLHGLPLPARQYKFHPLRKWTLDFAWLEKRVAVEVDGGLFIRGRHSRGASQEKDHEKRNSATACGWRVFVFGPKALYRKKRTAQPSAALTFMAGILNRGEL